VGSSVTIPVNFVEAAPDNLILLESVHNPGDTPVIQVETSENAQVYVAEGMDVFRDLRQGASACRFNGASALEKNSNNFVTIPLNGQDLVVYVCSQRTIHFLSF
jgi:hypothetical protein